MHGAVAICPEHAHPGRLQSIQQFGAGMAVGIGLPNGNDSDPGFDGVEELLRGGVLSAMAATFNTSDRSVSGGFSAKIPRSDCLSASPGNRIFRSP